MNTERNLGFNVTPENKLKFQLKALNGLMGLTKKELEVVWHFITLNPTYPCGSTERKVIYQKMKLKNVQALNNIIRSVTKKKVFIWTGNGYQYAKFLLELQNVTRINISFNEIHVPGREGANP